MFIYIKDKALPSEICLSFIENFEKSPELQARGVVSIPNEITQKKVIAEREDIKSSTDIYFTPDFLNNSKWASNLEILVKVLLDGLATYQSRYFYPEDIINNLEISPLFNLQRYHPNEGYKILHCENTGLCTWRCLTWMVYLNDVTDRGETEFFHQKHFETPEEGKLVIWPVDWTYAHRGIPSPTQTKYILTGWFDFVGIDKNVHYINDNKNYN